VENIAARTWIFLHLPADPQEGVDSMSPEGHLAVQQVLNSLDRVAFLTQSGWIPDDVIMPWMHPMISKSWEKLAPYIVYERIRRNEPYYYEHAESLALRCQKWRQNNLTAVDSKWVDDALSNQPLRLNSPPPIRGRGHGRGSTMHASLHWVSLRK
ncbi:MAG: DUF4760 domain-containing protein, partial [Anaerolineales bacterium]|nr:DUF4760 domain-containing protein [Anaerolineales bacterium]